MKEHPSETAKLSRQLGSRDDDRAAWQLGEPHPAYLDAMRGRDPKTDQLLGIGQDEEATHV